MHARTGGSYDMLAQLNSTTSTQLKLASVLVPQVTASLNW